MKKGEWACALLVCFGFVVIFLGVTLLSPLVFVVGSFLVILSAIVGVFWYGWDLFPSTPIFKP